MGLSRTVSETNGDLSRKSKIFPTSVYFAPPEITQYDLLSLEGLLYYYLLLGNKSFTFWTPAKIIDKKLIWFGIVWWFAYMTGAWWCVGSRRRTVWRVGGLWRHVLHGFHSQPGGDQRRQVRSVAKRALSLALSSLNIESCKHSAHSVVICALIYCT